MSEAESSGQRRVVVTGVGAISPLGDTPEAIWEALCAGESGMRPVELFDVSTLDVREGGEIAFDPKKYLEGNLRPLDRTGRLVVAAAQLALADSGWTRQLREQHPVGLVLGTMFCSVHTISAFDRRALEAGPKYAKPFEFANSVINAAAGQTAIWHDLRGINSTVAGGTTAGIQALAYAVEMIRNGRAEALLTGGGEELCFESFYGFCRTGRMAGSGNSGAPCAVPFDARRNGFALAEGAALFMLEEAGSARRRGARVLAEISGHAAAYDVSRGSDPQRAAEALARAVRLALQDAGCPPAEIGAVAAGANGSVAGDRHEAAGLADAFGGRLPPVTAVKSMLGESLGAAGAFQTLGLLESLRRGRLPGIRGLETVEEGLPLGDLRAEARPLAERRGLVSGVGLDGNACALVVETGGEG